MLTKDNKEKKTKAKDSKEDKTKTSMVKILEYIKKYNFIKENELIKKLITEKNTKELSLKNIII